MLRVIGCLCTLIGVGLCFTLIYAWPCILLIVVGLSLYEKEGSWH
jgi:hypothetical protein